MSHQMDNIQCSVNIDNVNKLIILQGLSESDLKINYTSDVDFTELVSLLTNLIDDSKKIDLGNFETAGDDKLALIMETLKAIISKYNESVSNTDSPIQEVDSQSADLPF
jgi:hypothetical protein